MSVLILDVSNAQGRVDFKQVANHGIKGVFLKATEGETYVDPTFKSFRTAANNAGLHVGYYHFARPDIHSDPTISANEFCKVVGKVGTRDLRPVLDFETASTKLSNADQVGWARWWNRIVWKKLGVLPLFYTYSAFEPIHAARRPIGAGLWLASYGRDNGQVYPAVAPRPWRHWSAHQFSSRCHVAGCGGLVDLSIAPSLTPLLAHPVKAKLRSLPYLGKH